MKTYQKIFVWFLIVALIVSVVGFSSLYQINRISKPLNEGIPAGVKEVADTSHLNSLAQVIRYYDEVLTQSARNYAFTQDKKWEKRYRDVEPELDRVIKEAIERGDEKDKEFFSSIDKANIALVEMEYQSIQFVDDGQSEKAIEILESDKYWDEKRIYEKGLVDYFEHRNIKYNEALLASTDIIETSTEEVRDIIKFNKRIMNSFVIGFIITVILIGFIVLKNLYDNLKPRKGIGVKKK